MKCQYTDKNYLLRDAFYIITILSSRMLGILIGACILLFANSLKRRISKNINLFKFFNKKYTKEAKQNNGHIAKKSTKQQKIKSYFTDIYHNYKLLKFQMYNLWLLALISINFGQFIADWLFFSIGIGKLVVNHPKHHKIIGYNEFDNYLINHSSDQVLEQNLIKQKMTEQSNDQQHVEKSCTPKIEQQLDALCNINDNTNCNINSDSYDIIYPINYPYQIMLVGHLGNFEFSSDIYANYRLNNVYNIIFYIIYKIQKNSFLNRLLTTARAKNDCHKNVYTNLIPASSRGVFSLYRTIHAVQNAQLNQQLNVVQNNNLANDIQVNQLESSGQLTSSQLNSCDNNQLNVEGTSKHVVCIAFDQVASQGAGVWVNFLGQKIYAVALTGKLILNIIKYYCLNNHDKISDRAVFVFFLKYTTRVTLGFRSEIMPLFIAVNDLVSSYSVLQHETLDHHLEQEIIQKIIQKVFCAFEKILLQYPMQYFWNYDITRVPSKAKNDLN